MNLDEGMKIEQLEKLTREEIEKYADQKMQLARGICQVKAPYFTNAIYSFIPNPIFGLGTIGVSEGLVLIYCPAWILMRTGPQCAFLLIHEVMHLTRQHPERRGSSDPCIFNSAGDLAINPDLIEAGWIMPDGEALGLLPEQFKFPKGLATEEYYDLLLKQQQQQPKRKKGGSGEDEDGEEGKGQGGRHKPGCGQGRCGGIAGNHIDEELEKQLDRDIGRTKVARHGLEKQIAEDVKRYAAEKGRGNIPASLLSWAQEDKKKSKIPWPSKLAAVLRKTSGRIQSGGMDFSLLRPSKRSYLRGILRPGMVQQEPEVAFIIDTSGSMGRGQIRTGLREARSVMSSVGVDQVWWLEADAAVANVPKRISAKALTNIELHGGGGTDFGPAIEACTKLRPRPDLIIYFTDGDGSAPDKPPPGVAVIWCIVPSYYNQKPASWGLSIIMRAEGDEKDYPQFKDDEDDDVD